MAALRTGSSLCGTMRVRESRCLLCNATAGTVTGRAEYASRLTRIGAPNPFYWLPCGYLKCERAQQFLAKPFI